MMKRLMFVAVAVMFLWASNSALAYNFSIVEDGTKDVSALSSISFDIFFNPDAGGNTFGTYAFALFYDTSELTFSSAAGTPPPSLFELFGPAYLDAPGHVINFNGASFGVDPSLTIPTKLGSVAFNINHNELTSAGGPDVWFDKGQNSGFTINNEPGSLNDQNSFAGANVVAPEPVSSILFLTGGAAMGIRRYFKKS